MKQRNINKGINSTIYNLRKAFHRFGFCEITNTIEVLSGNNRIGPVENKDHEKKQGMSLKYLYIYIYDKSFFLLVLPYV